MLDEVLACTLSQTWTHAADAKFDVAGKRLGQSWHSWKSPEQPEQGRILWDAPSLV